MYADRNFHFAVQVTITLLVLVIPIQLALAMAMALIVNARLRGSSLWLYIYALPLAISELAAGLVWVSIFQQRGWLNSILQSLGHHRSAASSGSRRSRTGRSSASCS